MELAREAQKPEGRRRPFARLSDVLEPHRPNHQPPWQKPVQRETARVNVERMVQHEQSRERERRLGKPGRIRPDDQRPPARVTGRLA
jgi:hypothetical protein